MREKTPQDYANELIQMYRANTQSIQTDDTETAVPIPLPSATDYDDGIGGLSVNVTTLRRLYPVKGAEVTVFTGQNSDMNIITTGITDESGKSGIFKLSAPPRADSQQVENGGQKPYSTYNVSVRSDGYVEQIAMNVPIFSGVVSVQGMDLTPISVAGKHTSPQIIEGGNDYNL